MSGGDVGLPADADGRLLPKPRDRPPLPDGDRGPVLRFAPEGPHAALPDATRPRRPQQRCGQRLPECSENTALTAVILCQQMFWGLFFLTVCFATAANSDPVCRSRSRLSD